MPKRDPYLEGAARVLDKPEHEVTKGERAAFKRAAWNAVGFVVTEYNPITTIMTDFVKEFTHRAVAHSLIWVGNKVFGFLNK